MFHFLFDITSNNWLFDPKLFDFLYDGRTDEECNVFIPKKIRKQRVQNQYTVEDHYDSVFYKNYILPSLQDNPHIKDVSMMIGKTFRRHFHVLFSVFLEICDSIKATHNLPDFGSGFATDAQEWVYI
jgi:hypothetical protein